MAFETRAADVVSAQRQLAHLYRLALTARILLLDKLHVNLLQNKRLNLLLGPAQRLAVCGTDYDELIVAVQFNVTLLLLILFLLLMLAMAVVMPVDVKILALMLQFLDKLVALLTLLEKVNRRLVEVDHELLFLLELLVVLCVGLQKLLDVCSHALH